MKRWWRWPLALLLVVAGSGCAGEPPRFLFAIGGSAVSAFTIDPKTGGLSAVPGSPFTAPDLVSGAAAVSVSGRFLYVGHRGQRAMVVGTAAAPGRISGSLIDARGALTPVPGAPVAVEGDVDWIAVPPPGRFLLATYTTWAGENRAMAGARAFSVYAIDDTTGALRLASTQPASEIRAVAVDAPGRFAYAVRSGARENRDDEIVTFTLEGVTGALSATGATPVAGRERPAKLVIAPSGRMLYVLWPPKSVPYGSGTDPRHQGHGWTSSVSAYAIDVTGALSPVPDSLVTVGSGAYWRSMAFAPTGKFLYVADSETPPLPLGGVWAYRVDETSGALTPVSTSPARAGANATAITVDRSGRFVYVASRGSAPAGPGSVWAYTIDQVTGALTPVPGSPFTTSSAPAAVVTTAPGP